MIGWTMRIIRGLLLILALALIVVTILPSVQTTTWWIRYLDFPRLEFTILMLFVGLALIAIGPRLLGVLALVGLAACVGYDCSILARYSALTDTQEIAAPSCPDGSRLRLLEVLPAFGSDHRPYLAELCYDPAAGRDQSPLQLRPDDLAIARADVVRGQNAADADPH